MPKIATPDETRLKTYLSECSNINTQILMKRKPEIQCNHLLLVIFVVGNNNLFALFVVQQTAILILQSSGRI